MTKKITILLILLFSNILLSQDKNGTVTDWKEKNSKKKIYSFIGEKISIENYEPPLPKEKYEINQKGDTLKIIGYTNMNKGFKAKYKVIQNVYNEIKTDTVEFIAFDHYGIPAFSKAKNVLLFLIKEKGGFYHCKYQYFEVFKTTNEKWAGIYDKIKYRRTRIIPIKIEFKNSISEYGNYAEDLFIIKKEGVLKSRGYFK